MQNFPSLKFRLMWGLFCILFFGRNIIDFPLHINVVCVHIRNYENIKNTRKNSNAYPVIKDNSY